MKKLSFFLVSLSISLSLLAQQRNNSTVIITVNGNKNLQVTIDGTVYTGYDNVVNGDKTTLQINDLENGQHSLEISRSGWNINRPEKISSAFYLRHRFDMQISLHANGSLEFIEKIKYSNYGNNTAMSNASFSSLLNQVKYQRTTSGKRTVIMNALNMPGNYFSCSQVIQLLQQVNSESYRLELAKLSYRTVTDRNNFYRVSSLLNSQYSRDELEDYVNNYYEDDPFENAMPDSDFDNLYETIREQWPVSTQMNSLARAFNNAENYFTSYQAAKLIQIVFSESDRLQLAKLSYRSIVDRENFYTISDLILSPSGKNELDYYIRHYQDAGNTGMPMPDAEFNSLYQTIKQQWPVGIQMNSLVNTFNNTSYYFTTIQASRLIQLVTGESNRLQLAKLSYRSITDPVNFTQVYSLLSTQSAKNELAAYVANYTGSGPGNKVAMKDDDFKNLYQDIQFQFLPGAKMTALTTTFNTANYYFNCAQARQLIELVSLETNRLQLCKLSYKTITDRGNFTLLYDLLSSQSSRDELQAYVNNYKE